MVNKDEMRYVARYSQDKQRVQCLWEHLESVANFAEKSAEKIGLGKIGRVIGLIHDLGKATEEFQQYLKYKVGIIDEMGKNFESLRVDHSTAGAQYLHQAFCDKGCSSKLIAEVLAMIVASHHGFMDSLAPDGKDVFGERINKDEFQTRKNEAVSNLSLELKEEINSLLKLNLDENLESFFNGIIDDKFNQSECNFMVSLLIRYLLSCLIDADRLNAADFDSPEMAKLRQHGKYMEWDELIVRLESHLKSLKEKEEKLDINNLRRDVAEKCSGMSFMQPGLFRLTVPTGGGKTLASFKFALQHAKENKLDRIIYVIPYTSIIDQNAKRLRGALEIEDDDFDTLLEYHSNLITTNYDEKDEANEKESHYKLLAENWDSPIVLTTMVQFLETIYGGGTNNCRRMHQLANSVLIFDEIQSLPINQIHLFNLAIMFLVNASNSTVMLCTATQPLLHEIEPKSRALPYNPKTEISVSSIQKKEMLNRVEIINNIKPSGWNHDDIAKLAFSEFSDNKSVLIIVNTKKDALEIFNVLENTCKGERDSLYHLSTSMYPEHRSKKLDKVSELLKDGRPLILVSTQLIEAGVDVDFNVVIRSLAGIDSIAQAAGRCNRHGKSCKGTVYLVNPNTENLEKLPTIKHAKETTERILNEFRGADGFLTENLLGDKVMDRYFKYYFGQEAKNMNYPVGQNSEIGRNDNLVELLSLNRKSVCAFCQQAPNIKFKRVLAQSFRSGAKSFQAIPHSGYGVIVSHGGGEEIVSVLAGVFQPQKHPKILRKAQRFSVNLFSHEFADLVKIHAVREVQKDSGIFYLDSQYYNDKTGWTLYKSSSMSTLTK